MAPHPAYPPHPPHPQAQAVAPRAQQGFTLLYAMLALLIMMVGAAAMVRAINTSVLVGANLGFKRDLSNQAERAAVQVMDQLQAGTLASEPNRRASNLGLNYSATLLPINAQGIPLALVDDSIFGATGSSSNDISVADQAVTVRYLIDRLCANTGVADDSHCSLANGLRPRGGDGSQLPSAEDNSASGLGALPQQVVYRLSVRVTGPRNTQAFFQSTFAL